MTVRHACMGTGAHTPVAVGAAAGYQSGRFAKGDAIAATDSVRLVSVHPTVAPIHGRGSCNGPCSSRQMPTPAARVKVSGQSKLTPPQALLWMTDAWDRVIPRAPLQRKAGGGAATQNARGTPISSGLLTSRPAGSPQQLRRQPVRGRHAPTKTSVHTPAPRHPASGGAVTVRKTGQGRGVHTPGALGAAAGCQSGLFARSC